MNDSEIKFEVVYARYGARYCRGFETIDEAFGFIEMGEDQNEMSAVGVYRVGGEPLIWDGYAEGPPPTDEQRKTMIDEYARAAKEAS